MGKETEFTRVYVLFGADESEYRSVKGITNIFSRIYDYFNFYHNFLLIKRSGLYLKSHVIRSWNDKIVLISK